MWLNHLESTWLHGSFLDIPVFDQVHTTCTWNRGCNQEILGKSTSKYLNKKNLFASGVPGLYVHYCLRSFKLRDAKDFLLLWKKLDYQSRPVGMALFHFKKYQNFFWICLLLNKDPPNFVSQQFKLNSQQPIRIKEVFNNYLDIMLPFLTIYLSMFLPEKWWKTRFFMTSYTPHPWTTAVVHA